MLALGALLLAGTSVYIAHDRMRAIEDADFGADILKATRAGVINRCGDRLCVRIGQSPQRSPKNPDYAVLPE